ncbi:MAG: ABC transporter ATP-binding protein [Proteobacteria bacterium]|nr:ABC transporter ATP-binding protein [Pseudomonadota bacterium]
MALERIEKRYGATTAVAGIDLAVGAGEFVTLLGPSGCGKTTTLNMIAGFIEPNAGSIRLDGRPIESLPPFKRDLGMVFQDYALFPHMTVAENVAFGLRMRKVDGADIARRVAGALDLVKLAGLGERRPGQLSGGQRQRVALARALVIRPKVLLLDEPLSNLDLKLREEMRLEISALQRRLGITTVFVTHDQGEALVMSDRIAVMNAGRIEQIASPRDIYERPASRFVAEFIGMMNFLDATAVGDPDAGGRARLSFVGGGEIVVPVPPGTRSGAGLAVTIRPERARLDRTTNTAAGAIAIAGRVARVVYLGNAIEVRLELAGGGTAAIEIKNDGRQTPPAPGEDAFLTAAPEDCWVVPRSG